MSGRILVVDDNQANLDLMLYLLKAFGYEPQGAASGPAGLEAARAGNFDLVLIDILMPGMDGYELARLLRHDARLASTPLVAVTALAMATDRQRIETAGFNGYIAKPIEPETFAAQIERYLKGTAS